MRRVPQRRLEIQVLDSYDNKSYADGQASAMYGQIPPMVNASRRRASGSPTTSSSAARASTATTLEKPAIVTVLHNGVVVPRADAFWGPTAHKRIRRTRRRTRRADRLQDHGNPVRFRNIWIRR
jgi:hypothetical protein